MHAQARRAVRPGESLHRRFARGVSSGTAELDRPTRETLADDVGRDVTLRVKRPRFHPATPFLRVESLTRRRRRPDAPRLDRLRCAQHEILGVARGGRERQSELVEIPDRVAVGIRGSSCPTNGCAVERESTPGCQLNLGRRDPR